MARLVTGLLARARTQTGVTEPEMVPLRLDQLVESVVDEFPSRHVTLTTTPTVVAGDPELLGLAVRNVIDNALTHGARTRAEVTVASGRVTIRDYGPGLDPSLTADPFDRGVPVQPATTASAWPSSAGSRKHIPVPRPSRPHPVAEPLQRSPSPPWRHRAARLAASQPAATN
ncbi:hypothetical protein TUM20985_00360 [Mycobacterium antarcticum]|nr:ATP-binding protein [Mycolicibacterium sp. TUM20985]BDX29489.1 hypothetical protein TUM20985_00360 [Mycolicibacterium sp. TUM20985]